MKNILGISIVTMLSLLVTLEAFVLYNLLSTKDEWTWWMVALTTMTLILLISEIKHQLILKKKKKIKRNKKTKKL